MVLFVVAGVVYLKIDRSAKDWYKDETPQLFLWGSEDCPTVEFEVSRNCMGEHS